MEMTEEEISRLHFIPIDNRPYSRWFQRVSYNGRIPTSEDKEILVNKIDEDVAFLSSGLPILMESIEESERYDDDYNKTCKVVYSALLFVITTMCDCMVASKYFISASNDYDKRFMRGKLKVILNEGFKQLYGFGGSKNKKTEWNKLKACIHVFPDIINQQYKELTLLLDKQAQGSLWWKDERDCETHIDAEKLYRSRNKDIVDSMVMIDTLSLYDALSSVSQFLTNVHAALYNGQLKQYFREHT